MSSTEPIAQRAASSDTGPATSALTSDEKRRYLDEVATTGFDRARIRADGTMRIERLRRAGVDAVATALATDEPRTSVVLCRLRGRWPDRTWVVRDAVGSIAGVVSLRWLSLDVWTVTVYLADPRAAALAAQLVDRSPARSLTGTAADVDPLLPFLTRARTQMSFPLLVARAPVAGILDDPDGGTRLADRHDLAALVELHRCDEIAPVRTAWQLRWYLWRLLRTTTVVVHVEDDRLVGSAVAQRVAGEFLVIDNVFVHPDARRHGVAWELGKRLLAIATEHQVGATGALAPTNPMEFPRDRVSYSREEDSTHHRLVSLAATRRFRGHGRLRRRYESIQPIASVTADVDLFRDPSDPAASPPGSSRAATQDPSM